MTIARVVIIMYMGTVMYVHNRVGTNVTGHKCAWPTIMYGYSRVGSQFSL